MSFIFSRKLPKRIRIGMTQSLTLYASELNRRSLMLLETDLDAKDDDNKDKRIEMDVEQNSPPEEESIKDESPKSATSA
jgi:stringent starvation protein B